MAELYGTNTPMENGCMDWEDILENDGQEFVLLEDGDYTFEVVGFERGRFPGSAKIPSCNKATVTLQVNTEKGVARVKTDLLLYRSLEWKISSFFRCIGMKKQGEKAPMDWNHVEGKRGRARFKTREYVKDGETRKVNDVDRFYDFDEEKMLDTFTQVGIGDDDELPFD